MQFRCYLCSFLMHDGPPPISALSNTQIMGVGASEIDQVDQRMKSRVMDGTRFEGLSSGSFCAFCLTAITQYPSMGLDNSGHEMEWLSNSNDYRATIQWIGVVCHTCDERELCRSVIDTSKGEFFTRFDDCRRSRHAILHHVRMLYPNADLSELAVMLETEA